jgi:hypothetical protein
MKHIFNQNYKPRFHDDNAGPIKRFVGVEMEISDFNKDTEPELEAVVRKWGAEIVDDGSVYGENPFELRTAPAKGMKFIEQIGEICNVLKKGKAEANDTCGLHVHVDARDFTPDDLIKVAAIWPKLENKFWNLTTADRKDGEWCPSWDYSLDKSLSLIEMYDDIKENLLEYGDRSSLNLQALEAHGTIENRMHHGTTSFSKIVRWAKLNDKFMTLVKDMSVKDAMKFDSPSRVIRTKRTKPYKARKVRSYDY